MNEPMGVSRQLRWLWIALLFVSVCGCQDELGTGGTGELIVPNQRLRELEPIALSAASQPSTQPATAPAEEALSIEQCRQFALQNNLDLKVELLNPTIARTALTAEQARFEAVFFSSVNYASSRTLTGPGTAGPRVDELTPDVGLQIPLRTGGLIRIDEPFDQVHTHEVPAGPRTVYETGPQVSINQPLLRGGGIYVNTQPIRVAFYEYQRAQALTKLEVIRVLADVDRAYWRLYAARGALRVRRAEYESARAQLERARHQVDVGTGVEVDVIRAESGVADTLDSILTSENLVRMSERELKRILNRPGLGLETPTTVITATAPANFPYQLDPQRLADAALRQRMEMLDLELQIAEQASNVRVARNGLLPLVNASYSYGVSGLGTTPGGAFNQAWERTAAVHRAGLQLEIPIGNEVARSDLRRAMLNRMQALASREQRVVQIRKEVYDAVDTLQTDWQRTLSTHQRVILNRRTLDAEIRQFQAGLRTTTDVLIAQANLADAELSEVSAISDYQIAQVDIAFATGTVLGATRVVWDPTPAPKP